MKRILMIDDQIVLYEPVVRLLRDLGYAVYKAKTITDARRELAQVKFDVVICDGSVDKRGDGAKLAYEIHRAGQTPVVLFSGSDWSGDYPDLPWVLKGDTTGLLAKINEVLGLE